MSQTVTSILMKILREFDRQATGRGVAEGFGVEPTLVEPEGKLLTQEGKITQHVPLFNTQIKLLAHCFCLTHVSAIELVPELPRRCPLTAGNEASSKEAETGSNS